VPELRTQLSALPLERLVALLSGSDFWNTETIPEADVPSVLLTDGPHGVRRQPDDADHLGIGQSVPATCFPTASSLGSSWDVCLLEEVGAALGREARAGGVSVLLGPGLNIKRHPGGGRNFEYLSEDPLLSGRLAAAIVRGTQSEGVAACLKHFVANNAESYRMVSDSIS
jgi:beta-glucosidase